MVTDVGVSTERFDQAGTDAIKRHPLHYMHDKGYNEMLRRLRSVAEQCATTLDTVVAVLLETTVQEEVQTAAFAELDNMLRVYPATREGLLVLLRARWRS